MTTSALAAQAALEFRFGAALDEALDSLLPAPTEGGTSGGGGEPLFGDEQMSHAAHATTLALNRLNANPSQAAILRDTALRHVADRFEGGRDRLAWCTAQLKAGAAILGAIETTLYQPPTRKDFLFFPSDACRERLLGYIQAAVATVEVAIFSLTDDRIRDALLAVHRRGVKVRVISDNETSLNEGSDIMQLAEAGVATVVDHDLPGRGAGGGAAKAAAVKRHSSDEGGVKRHMHNKFVVCDGRLLLTGSFNFTYAASSKNFENLLVTDDSFYVQRYSKEFETLWTSFWGSTYEDKASTQQAVVRLQAIMRGRKARRMSVEMGRATKRSSFTQGLGMESFPALGS